MQINEKLINTRQRDITTDGLVVKCGYKIDGKDVYVARIYFGTLPNATTKAVPTGIDFSAKTVIKMEAMGKISASNIWYPIPNPNASALNFAINITLNNNNIVIDTGTDRSGQVAWVNIYYINNS